MSFIRLHQFYFACAYEMHDNNSNTDSDEYYDWIVEQHALASTTLLALTGRYENWILTTTGSALALTSVLIGKGIEAGSPKDALLSAMMAWILFAIGLTVELYSIKFSCGRKESHIWDLEQKHREYYRMSSEEDPPNREPMPRVELVSPDRIHTFESLALLSIVLGLIVLTFVLFRVVLL